MKENGNAGVFQLENGNWGYRYSIKVDGELKTGRRTKDDSGNPFKTEKQAVKARNTAIAKEQMDVKRKKPIQRKTFAAVFAEYCEKGRKGKAYATIRKQESLWNVHLKERFGNKYVDGISVAEIIDYLSELYYEKGYSYRYVESFLKMFYLILGQAYSRNYLDMDTYNKLCVNRDTKIHMPKMKTDEDMEIVIFSREEMQALDEYFCGTNAETAYMIGKYCGLRINECYGLKWCNVDLKNGTILIDRQMQYENEVIKLVPLKTRNAKRTMFMAPPHKEYMTNLYEKKIQSEKTLAEQREQNQIFIEDIDGASISSLELVNTLENGKRQTINSMKYHAEQIQEKLHIYFKYHFLRHTYGTALADRNTPVHILCNQMGHASVNVTQKYYIAVSKTGIETLKANLSTL